MEINVVACAYRMPQQTFVKRLSDLLSSYGLKVTGYVASAKCETAVALDNDWTALPSDNEDFDFSAYQVGANAVLTAGRAHHLTLFVNDTLFTNHAAAANLRAMERQFGLMQSLAGPAIAGKCDRYTAVCLRNPWNDLSTFVSTYCFALNEEGLGIFVTLPELADLDGLSRDRSLADASWGSELSHAFREFMRAHLVYKSSPYLWYRLRKANFSAEQLRSKARCFYFEQRLSGEIGKLGCIVPINAGPRWSMYLAFHERLGRIKRRIFS